MQRSKDALNSSCSAGNWRGYKPLTLPDVLLQLVMQCCDQATRFALARCNRDTMRAASHVVAWKHLHPIDISRTMFRFFPHILRGLVRFTETAVIIGDLIGIPDDAIKTIPRIRSVHFTMISNLEIHRICSLPELAHIHTMTLNAESNIPSIVIPPFVHTLRLNGPWHPIHHEMPNLTHLNLNNLTHYSNKYSDVIRLCNNLRLLSLGHGTSKSLRSILMGRLPHLHTLILNVFRVTPGEQFSFACLMNLPALQHVFFESPYAPGELADEWIKLLSSRNAKKESATCSLRTLRFEGVFLRTSTGQLIPRITVEQMQKLLMFSFPPLRFELGLSKFAHAHSAVSNAFFPAVEPTSNEIRADLHAVCQAMVSLDPTRVSVI